MANIFPKPNKQKPQPFERIPCYDSNIPWNTSDGKTFLAGFFIPAILKKL